MSKRANPTMVGLFVLAGLVLAIAGVIIFGSLQWFSPVSTFIIYFEESAEGLDEGSVVKLRGVAIGRVKEVLIHFNQREDDYYLPVLVEINNDKLAAKTDREFELRTPAELKKAIQRGLRARLEIESFFTGRLYVSLSMATNAAPVFLHQVKPIYEEIPSELTELAQLKRHLTQVDIVGVTEKLNRLLEQANHIFSNLQTNRFTQTVVDTLHRVNRVVGSPEITNALVSVRRTADDVRRLVNRLEQQVDPVAADARKTLAEASQTLAETRQAVSELRNLLNSRSPFRTELDAALSSLSDAAASMAALADLLRRNPQELIFGPQPSSHPK